MATYTFKWKIITDYTTQVEADSEVEAHEDLLNDIKMDTNFEDDIVNQDFIIPSESVGVQFGNTEEEEATTYLKHDAWKKDGGNA